MNIDD